MSQEQKDRVEQQKSDLSVTPPTPTTAGEAAVEETQKVQEEEQASTDATATLPKKRKRKTRLVNAEEVSPRPSYWPLILAFAIALVLFGIIAGPIVVVIGVLLAFVAVGGWVLERR